MKPMKVDLGIWDWLRRLIVFLLVGVAAVAVVLWYLPLIRRNEETRRSIHQEEQNIRRLVQQTNILLGEIRAYDHKETIERLARERLSLAKPDEIVFRFPEPSSEGEGPAQGQGQKAR